MNDTSLESEIIEREKRLQEWFTRKCDPIMKIIDGLDIGWAGVQRWATAKMPELDNGPHLDFACGYGTFLAQLGWRFPNARLVGLNIDYAGPHASIHDLLTQAGVKAELVEADARKMPFADCTFASASCFLGLQDIEIGFGQEGVREALSEAVRILWVKGSLVLLDEFAFEKFDKLLNGLPVKILAREERALDVQWNREVAEKAIALYAKGWVTQTRVTDPKEKERVCEQAYAGMKNKMEQQFQNQGFYVPFGPVRMVLAQKEK